MISNTLGAPLGGTIVGGQNGFDWAALSLMTPPNFSGGAGSCLPLMVVVASGEPGAPVACGGEVLCVCARSGRSLIPAKIIRAIGAAHMKSGIECKIRFISSPITLRQQDAP